MERTTNNMKRQDHHANATVWQYVSILLVFVLQVSFLIPCILASGTILTSFHTSQKWKHTLLIPIGVCFYGVLWLISVYLKSRYCSYKNRKHK